MNSQTCVMTVNTSQCVQLKPAKLSQQAQRVEIWIQPHVAEMMSAEAGEVLMGAEEQLVTAVFVFIVLFAI